MSRPRSHVRLRIHGLKSNPGYERLVAERVLERVRKVDAEAREEGFSSLNPAADPLFQIGMEIGRKGRVTKNGYGVLHLPWLAEQNPQWPGVIEQEAGEIKKSIKGEHGSSLRYVIWAGMGGSAEDKAFYQGAKLFNRGVRVYLLDSTDPAKLKAILEHIVTIGKQPLQVALRRTLVVGMAMGMTSYEPVLNLEVLDALYRKLKIASQANFIYMTLPGSILDEFGKSRGFRRVELQPDNGNSTAGRHSGPLTRGSLYPLALNRCDLPSWMRATFLSQEEIAGAFELAGFIQANAKQGRDKLTLFLPREWSGGAIWTKQDFEESLGKSEKIGLKVAIGEKIKLRNYFAPKDTLQDRCFLVVNVRGLKNVDTVKVGALRRAGYPLALLNLHGKAALARYMQVIHYTVFGLGYLRNMNFVTQPSVELYKTIANDLNVAAKKEGGIEKTETWRSMLASDCRLKWRGGLSVSFEALCELGLLRREALNLENRNAAAVYAEALRSLVESQQATYGELTYFGDTRYSTSGKALRRVLDRAAEGVFRSRLKMPADVYEGPAMNHSYHEMIIGYGRGFSTVLLTEKAESFRRVPYPADYHRAQWLATQQALASRGRAVVGITIRDLSERSRQTVAEFFAEVARRLARRRS